MSGSRLPDPLHGYKRQSNACGGWTCETTPPPHDKNGHLHINGHDSVTLAHQYGTPLYVTSEDRVCEQFGSYKKALTSRYPKVRILFAAKANGNLAVMRALARLGAGADVFSSGDFISLLKLEYPQRPPLQRQFKSAGRP